MKDKYILGFRVSEQEKKQILKDAKRNGFSSISSYISFRIRLQGIILDLKNLIK